MGTIFNINVKILNIFKSISENLVIIFVQMPIKKMLIGFFLLFFSFLLVPVHQVGFFIYNNQIAEEIPHGQDDSGMKYPDDTLKQLIFTYSDQEDDAQTPGYFLKGQAVDINIKTRSSDDIQTPPPNHISGFQLQILLL